MPLNFHLIIGTHPLQSFIQTCTETWHRIRTSAKSASALTLWSLGRGADNQNGNLRWYLPLGAPLPLNGTNFQTFFYPTFFLLQLNPTYMKRILHLRNVTFKSSYHRSPSVKLAMAWQNPYCITKPIQHGISHTVWVLPCHHISHGYMVKPM